MISSISRSVVIVLSAFLIPLAGIAQNRQKPDRYYHLLVGTYTSGASEGIYVYRFDAQTGEVEHEFTARGVENPSFLAAPDSGNVVYAVNELGGGKEGGVSAFRFDRATGGLQLLNSQPSGGGSPCYLTVSHDGKFLFTANYSGGNLTALPLAADGSLLPPVQVIQHHGSSVNEARQKAPHVHSVVFEPDGEVLFASDLGTDQVSGYRYDPLRHDQPLTPARPAFTAVEPGTGPRHLVFNKRGDRAYLVQELTATVTVFRHRNGRLKEIQHVSMNPPDFAGENGAAEIRISPDGRFLYASNRGDANLLTIWSIDPRSGKLTLAGHQPTLGETPRNFMISPDGRFLLAANQNSDNIVIFSRDPASGLLTATGHTITVGNPVCLMMLPVR